MPTGPRTQQAAPRGVKTNHLQSTQLSMVRIRRGHLHPPRNPPLPLPSRDSAHRRDYPSRVIILTPQPQNRVITVFLTCKPKLHGCLYLISHQPNPYPHLQPGITTQTLLHGGEWHQSRPAAGVSNQLTWASAPPSSARHSSAYRRLPSTLPRSSEAPLSCRAVCN